MNEMIISFENVSKSYKRDFWSKTQLALNLVSFQVPKGTIYGFLGANGAGKTSAIKLIMGLQKASTGNIKLWGQNPESQKQRVGFLPERPYFHENLSAEEFLHFHRNLYFNNKENFRKQSNDELLKLVGLSHAKKMLLKQFSKGMLQRIGIAQALVNDPELIVLDEPMSGLDPIGRRDVRNLIQQLAAQGKTIFFSSHILSDIESLCSQITFLEKGKLKYSGKIDDLLHKTSAEQEILFRKVEAKKISTNTFLSRAQKMGENWRITAQNPSEAKKIIEAVWSVEAELLNIQSHHRSLEEALFGTDLNSQLERSKRE